jgi:hypothetical protein
MAAGFVYSEPIGCPILVAFCATGWGGDFLTAPEIVEYVIQSPAKDGGTLRSPL